MSEPNKLEQAFNILSAAHIEMTIENRILRASNAQLTAKVQELTPKPDNVVPIETPAA